MRPLDFYELGLEIANSAKTEAQQRTAINRVYYGLHHEACCRHFRTEGGQQPLNQNRCHTDLRNRLNDSLDPKAGEVGQLLGGLMRLRGEADYQLQPPLRYQNRPFTPEQLMLRALYLGEDLLDALEGYSPGEAADGCRCPVVYSAR